MSANPCPVRLSSHHSAFYRRSIFVNLYLQTLLLFCNQTFQFLYSIAQRLIYFFLNTSASLFNWLIREKSSVSLKLSLALGSRSDGMCSNFAGFHLSLLQQWAIEENGTSRTQVFSSSRKPYRL
jgi:hypothetical protein